MSSTDKSVSRREFARRAALGAASASLLPLRELVPLSAVPAPPQPAQAPVQNPAPAPKLSAQNQAEADSRYQAIINQCGDRFSEAQKSDLKRLCIFIQLPLDRLRSYAVANDDLPALYLKPLVDRDKKPASNSGAPVVGAKPSITRKP